LAVTSCATTSSPANGGNSRRSSAGWFFRSDGDRWKKGVPAEEGSLPALASTPPLRSLMGVPAPPKGAGSHRQSVCPQISIRVPDADGETFGWAFGLKELGYWTPGERCSCAGLCSGVAGCIGVIFSPTGGVFSSFFCSHPTRATITAHGKSALPSHFISSTSTKTPTDRGDALRLINPFSSVFLLFLPGKTGRAVDQFPF